MKIAFLAAANSIHGIRWVKYFAEIGHEILWISLAPPSDEAKELIKKVRFYEAKPSPLSDINGPFAIRHLPFAVRQINKILKSIEPHLLHVHSAGTYGLVAALTGFHPLVLTPWGSDILLTSPFKKPLVRYVVRSADFYTCDGNNTFQKLVELGAPKEKISLIRFGTDTEKFKPAQYKGVEHPQGKLKIISLRSLEPIYDIETLIRAAATVAKETSGVEFLIAGDGNQREHLEKLADSLKLRVSQTLKFVGKIKADELPKYLQEADIYVSTSLSDSGLSASTAEAMASGLPVIVTDSGDNKEWVSEGQGGFVVPVKNPELLAEKIIYLLKNPDLMAAFGEHNRRMIEEKNNYRKEMAKVEKIYENVVKSG